MACTTVTVKVCVALNPPGSVAVTVIVVVPTAFARTFILAALLVDILTVATVVSEEVAV